MIIKPILGTKVMVLENKCCGGKHKKGEIGTIVEIWADDFFLVATKDAKKYPNSAWWHRRKCVAEAKKNTKQEKTPQIRFVVELSWF